MTDDKQPVNKFVRKYFSDMGKKGGVAVMQKYGRDHYVRMRKLSTGGRKPKIASDSSENKTD